MRSAFSLLLLPSRLSFPLLLTGLLLVTGCSPSGEETANDAATDEPEATVGVSLLTLTHPFFQNLAEAMRQEAQEQNFNVTITSCEFDVARQRNQVSDFIVKGVDAIVLSPCDSKAIGTSIQEANEAGIPVFTADIAALAEDAEVVTHIATNNYEGGQLAAEAVLDAVGGQGQVAIIDHPEVESVIMRTEGFKERLKESGANVEVVAQLPAGGVKDRAFKVAQDILQAHPGLDAIFAINDDTALGALAALEQAGKTEQVKIVGFDGTLEARKAIRDGKIFADVIQHPRQIGRKTIQAIDSYLSGEQLPSEMLIPATRYDQSDARSDSLLVNVDH